MDGFERRRNEKKEAIIRAALELFSAHGFERVNMTEVAAKAHVSKVSIYNFFESKENLRRVIIRKIMDDSLERLNALVGSEEPLIEKVKKYLGSHQHPYNFVDFFFDAIESDFELKEYYEKFSSENTRTVKGLIQNGKEIGVFSREISDMAIEMYIDMYMSYAIRNPKVWEMAEQNPTLFDGFNKLFINGLIQQEIETAYE